MEASSSTNNANKYENFKSENSIEVISQSYVNCQVSLTVEQASRLVAQQIMEQILPESRLMKSVGKDTNIKEAVSKATSSTAAKTSHRLYPGQAWAVAMENFGREVLLPYFLANSPEDCHPSTLDHDRIFYASLLAFREVMVQNADTLFVFPEPLQGHSSSCEATSKEQNNVPPTANPEMKKDDANKRDDELEDEYNHLKWVMATSIVLGACQASGRDDSIVMELMLNDFPQIQHHYDNWMADLSSRKIRTIDGTTLSSAESMAWRISQFLALRSLLANQKSNASSMSTKVPEPTACWISVIESIPSNFMK
jgi:hypothetical protein